MATLIVQLYESNYPELLRRVYVINGNIRPITMLIFFIDYCLYTFATAPKIFSVAFAMLKPFLHERTTNKILIFSHNPEEWKPAILADVEPDQLPGS